MKDVRIEPTGNPEIFFVDIVCGCGRQAAENVDTGVLQFKHPVALGAGGAAVRLACPCGRQYAVTPQKTHFHVSEAGRPA